MYQSCVSVHEIQRHFCEMYKCMCRSNYNMTYYQSVYRYSCFAKAVQTQQIKKKKVVQSNPNISHFKIPLTMVKPKGKIGNDCSPHLVRKPTMKMYLGAPLNKTGCSL